MNKQELQTELERCERLGLDCTDVIQALIDITHADMGINPDHINDTPQEMPKTTEAYDGMRFFINVNEAEEGNGSQTMHVVHGSFSRRENKRALRKYLDVLGYKDKAEQKRILKALGFWGKTLGTEV